MRSLWKGAISFGLVHIPVRLLAATEDHDIHFRQLHSACHAPLEYRKVCPACAREVAGEEIERGYEVRPGEFVILGDDDLSDLPLPTAHTVAIADFVRLADVDPLFFARSYYLAPQEGGARPYALLREVLRTSGRAAVATVAIRSKESLALVRVVEGILVLELMHSPGEIRDWHQVEGVPSEMELGERELAVASDLVDRLSGPWTPERYPDRYREALLARIGARTVTRAAPESTAAPAAPYGDLLAALEASVRQVERDREAAGGGRR